MTKTNWYLIESEPDKEGYHMIDLVYCKKAQLKGIYKYQKLDQSDFFALGSYMFHVLDPDRNNETLSSHKSNNKSRMPLSKWCLLVKDLGKDLGEISTDGYIVEDYDFRAYQIFLIECSKSESSKQKKYNYRYVNWVCSFELPILSKYFPWEANQKKIDEILEKINK